jgi:hypothetical protein
LRAFDRLLANIATESPTIKSIAMPDRRLRRFILNTMSHSSTFSALARSSGIDPSASSAIELAKVTGEMDAINAAHYAHLEAEFSEMPTPSSDHIPLGGVVHFGRPPCRWRRRPQHQTRTSSRIQLLRESGGSTGSDRCMVRLTRLTPPRGLAACALFMRVSARVG